MVKRLGQLGNRLFTFAHVIANSIENGYSVINPNLDQYASYFECSSTNNFNGYPISVRLFKSTLFNKVTLPLDKKIIFNLASSFTNTFIKNSSIKFITDQDNDYEMNSPHFIENAKNKTVIAHGWLFRDKKNFNKHADTLRKLFKPIELHRTNVNNLIHTCRKECEILIGVHMRKGDYATFRGGEYYYDTTTYVSKLLNIKELLESRYNKISFLICSNEPVDVEAFTTKGLTVHLGTNHFIEDLYSLAECDYIIGPPSSYSTWASFYGNKPICILRNKEQLIKLEDFEVYLYKGY
ncbi:hypothetical protein GXP67_25745 [Rhodocytophaga rosea]|uniref:Alpha-1,2-fucosyltransferase n=1 Tax=Rhodocytophaga rosea TaxID=2704465 RepID=A0A6C0GP45_9BACT|nr:alpha-1,2-fucosyltransferase [Rhodocytophaga rosea]QHT69805.1 hypothetical protein GXP67_25745 [Rhodocytophaga rosea]